MNNFKKDGFRKGGAGFGGKPKFGGGKFGGPGRGHDRGHGRDDRGGEKTEMFSATCSACHKACEVPFRPSGDKPVYCRECFIEKGPNDNRVGKSFEKRSDFSREARPQRDSRPSYRDEAPAHKSSGNEELKKQIAILETKLNRVIELLTVETVKKVEVITLPDTSETPKKAKKTKIEKVKVKKITKKKGTKKVKE